MNIRGHNFWSTLTIQPKLIVSMSSSGSIVSIHKLTAQEELLFLRGEGRRKDLKDPLLDFGENSQIVVPYLNWFNKYIPSQNWALTPTPNLGLLVYSQLEAEHECADLEDLDY